MVPLEGRVKLSIAAKTLGISYRHAQRLVYANKIPTIVTDSGHRFVPVLWLKSQIGPQATGSRCAIYSRESSTENKAALKNQTKLLKQFAATKGYTITHLVEEFGSGVNDQRKKLHSLLQKRSEFDILLVEHKDRLTRFGFNWFEATCPFQIEVINRAEDKTTDLMDDLIAIVTSFSARLYGQRRGKQKTIAAINAIKSN